MKCFFVVTVHKLSNCEFGSECLVFFFFFPVRQPTFIFTYINKSLKERNFSILLLIIRGGLFHVFDRLLP